MGKAGQHKKLYPLLKDLQIHVKNNRVSALDLLNHLLETNVLKDDDVQTAFDHLLNELSAASAKAEEEAKKQASKHALAVPTVRRRHIALRLYYDGAKYGGLAQNFGQDTDHSVEKELFEALIRTNLIESRDTSNYSRCGRTDKGVSAAGQVAAFQLKSSIPLTASRDEQGNETILDKDLPKNEQDSLAVWVTPRQKKNKKNDAAADGPPNSEPKRSQRELKEYPYASMLNNLLPDDIRVLGWCPVSDEFSARFSAINRTYRYFFLKRRMSLDLIQKGLDNLVGKHDFRNFCKMDVQKIYNFERLIHSASVVEAGQNGACYLLIVGQAFLWHQIRCIAHIIFLVGRGLESPDIITDMLDITKYPGKPSYHLAPERPLVLHECGYPNLQLGFSMKNMWSLAGLFESQWEENILAAARIKNCMEKLHEFPVSKEECIEFAATKRAEREKKRQRYYGSTDETDKEDNALGGNDSENNGMVLWGQCLPWLERRGLIPNADPHMQAVHVPMSERSQGTTYEEKLEALQHNDRRRNKYNENVVKKRKTAEEDAEFYRLKLQQGGSAI